MSSRDPNSPGRNPNANSPGRNPNADAEETTKASGPQRAGDRPGQADIRWIRGEWNQVERRLPENARVRRWMDLADQVLQGEEAPVPAGENLDKAGD